MHYDKPSTNPKSALKGPLLPRAQQLSPPLDPLSTHISTASHRQHSTNQLPSRSPPRTCDFFLVSAPNTVRFLLLPLIARCCFFSPAVFLFCSVASREDNKKGAQKGKNGSFSSVIGYFSFPPLHLERSLRGSSPSLRLSAAGPHAETNNRTHG